MKKQIPFFLFILMGIKAVNAQTDKSIFDHLKQVESNEYVLSVPERWKQMNHLDREMRDQRFEFTDVGLPHTLNNAPLTAFFTLRYLPCEKEAIADSFIINEFSSYSDRVVSPNYDYATDTITISSGEKATLFHTRYYRRTKASNFTRYDMVVYSDSRKTAYMLTSTFQYKDPNYMLEADFKLKDYIHNVYSSLHLR